MVINDHKYITELLYRAVLMAYQTGAKCVALFNDKARKFVAGQENLLEKIASQNIASYRPIWFHCASLGEFEQARDLIDKLSQDGHKILLTFFSPSGYEHRKNYKNANWVFYLPFDNQRNAAQFLKLTNPSAAIFVKYDLWYFHLKTLTELGVPKYLISAIYKKDQIYFRPILGKLHRQMLRMFECIYLQDTESQSLLKQIEINSTVVVGDTRVDSVIEGAKKAKPLPIIASYLGGEKAIILGSAYLKEVNLLNEMLTEIPLEKIIIAPHNVESSNIHRIRKSIPLASQLYSELVAGEEANSNILIIDNIGLLFNVYQFGKWAFIGGAFEKGLHNTLEPAAFGLPICFGPKYHKFIEAVKMVELGCAFELKNANDLKALYLQMENEENLTKASDKAKKFLESSAGATLTIKKEIAAQMQKK